MKHLTSLDDESANRKHMMGYVNDAINGPVSLTQPQKGDKKGAPEVKTTQAVKTTTKTPARQEHAPRIAKTPQKRIASSQKPYKPRRTKKKNKSVTGDEKTQIDESLSTKKKV